MLPLSAPLCFHLRSLSRPGPEIGCAVRHGLVSFAAWTACDEKTRLERSGSGVRGAAFDFNGLLGVLRLERPGRPEIDGLRDARARDGGCGGTGASRVSCVTCDFRAVRAVRAVIHFRFHRNFMGLAAAGSLLVLWSLGPGLKFSKPSRPWPLSEQSKWSAI